MDEQRIEAYLNLIQALLRCANGEESQILNAHQDLVDDGLVQTMEYIAPIMSERSDHNAANYLRYIAAQISFAITPEEYRIFLDESLKATWHNTGNLEAVYPFLRANLDKLDDKLARLITDWAIAVIPTLTSDEAVTAAATVADFSKLLQEFPWVNTADNLEIAIAGSEAAQTVLTHDDFPKIWALIENTLGIIYSKRIYCERADNLEQAITYHENALQILTPETSPEDWAMSQHNLASVYWQRIRGNKAENLEKAITSSQNALLVRTREGLPQQWANTQSNLILIFWERIQGDRAENLEQAIACGENASQVFTREAFPTNWAGIQNNLALVYRDRIRGDRADNLELAINCCQDVLQIFTREAFPEKWAWAQHNLATAYCQRVYGNPAENLQLSITCSQNALKVFTRQAFPEYWARTQMNLGNAYLDHISENQTDNLDLSITCYQNALQVLTYDTFPEYWALLKNNLGIAYEKRSHGLREKNLEQAVIYYQNALQVFTRDTMPEKWAMTQINLCNIYSEQGLLSEVLKSAELLLELYTPTSNPLNCFVAGRHLGNAASTAGLWSKAIQGYAIAINALEQKRNWATSEFNRQKILEDFIGIYPNMVQVCIKNGQLDKAIEYVERSRSKRLVDLMASNDLYQGGEISPEIQQYLQQFDSLQQQIDRIRFNDNSATNREMVGVEVSIRDRAALEELNETIKTLENEKQQIWQKLRQLDPVLAGEIQVSAPDFATMQQLLDQPTTAILSFYTTDNDTHVFVLRQNQISCHTCMGQGLDKFQNWIVYNWLAPYVANKVEWHSQISTVLGELAERLRLDHLIAKHLHGLKELIIVPHLSLHQIPFAALPIGDPKHLHLGDKFLIRYIPSCQVLEFCNNRPQLGSQLTYGTVEDATENLPYANFEGEQIAQLYNIPEDRRLRGRIQATVSNYRQLAKQVQVLHSSHHAQSRLDNPLESKLELADGTITLGQLMSPGWRLPHLSDVFLSCCETGLGVTEITDDILTLSSGFLCAGARSVVSTLWSVDDLATALFSIFYYQHRQQGSCRPTALQQAQKELRSLTGKTLATVYQPQLTLLLDGKFQQAEKARKEAKANRDKEAKGTQAYLKWDEEYKRHYKAAERIRKTKNRLNALCQESFSFSHPFYWAAFTCSGLR